MAHPDTAMAGDPGRDARSLRLVWPQWQGAGTSSVMALASEFPFDVARRGYAVGAAVLEAVLPPHEGPTATVPVRMSDGGLAERDGVEAKTVVVEQLASALEVIGRHDAAQITTLGGECSVSVAPFSELDE
jgi:arginase